MEQGVYWADIAFPVLSFVLTIVGPALVACWVIVRTVQDMRRKDQSAPQTSSVAPGKGNKS